MFPIKNLSYFKMEINCRRQKQVEDDNNPNQPNIQKRMRVHLSNSTDYNSFIILYTYIMQQRYLIGTLFEEEELNKKMNINNTKLKDPFGNVRWKGAFTGGFQAGYKNTCGSKDGWVPSSFVSSIGSRGERKQQNIFDFMDKQDLGRQNIGLNISMKQNFTHATSNPFNISVNESVGQKILSKMKKKQAFTSAPEDIKQLHKLLQNLQQQEKLESYIQNYNLKGVEGFNSVGATQTPDDDFIVAYDDFFRKVIRASIKEQTEQQIAKRRQENKVYFDFTRPLEQQPTYLKQIQQLQEISKPKKRRRNVINDKNLKDLFKIGATQLKIKQQSKKLDYQVPEDYDPYHRVKNLKDKEMQLVSAADQKRKHRVQSLNQRSDLLSQGKLASRFVSASSNISSNKFVRSGQQQSAKALHKIFDDERKNKRYWDYVLELQGKAISAQLENLSYQEAEKQKQEFQKIYKLKQNSSTSNNTKSLPKKVEQALKLKNKKQIRVVRKTGFWKPQRVLCKRFGCMLPYKQQNPIHQTYQTQR